MGTEDEPQSIVGEIATALLFWSDAEPDVPRLATKHCYEAAKAIVAASPVLAWITANPEAAKGLASGEMVAVPKGGKAEMDFLTDGGNWDKNPSPINGSMT